MAEKHIPLFETLEPNALSDEEIRLRCLDYVTRKQHYIPDLAVAKEFYEWVIDGRAKVNNNA